MKRFVASIMAVILIISTTVTVSAASEEATDAAKCLYELGLFSGTGVNDDDSPIFSLDRVPTRNEAITMLVALLGKTNVAMQGTWQTPFTDVAPWAKPFVGYAYANGLTAGTSQTTYGGDEPVTATQYLTFVLKALGYQTGIDFQWDQAWKLSDQIGITDGEYQNGGRPFLREDIALISRAALEATDKTNGETLVHKMLWDNVFTTAQLDSTHDGSLMLAADMPDLIGDGVTVYNLDDLYNLILLSVRNGQQGIGINVPGYTYDELLDIFNAVRKDPLFDNRIYAADSVNGQDNYIYPHITIDMVTLLECYYSDPQRFEKNYKIYRQDLWYDQDEFDIGIYDLHAWVTKVDQILRDTVTEGMTEAEKAKALHDYICRTTVYDMGYEGNAFMTPHFASNLIFGGHGVCDGYASAYKILFNAAGIECNIIWGYGSRVGHAWNQAKIDGQWYNFDVCWDDTAYNGQICYDYFGKSSTAFCRDGHEEFALVKQANYCPEDLKMW